MCGRAIEAANGEECCSYPVCAWGRFFAGVSCRANGARAVCSEFNVFRLDVVYYCCSVCVNGCWFIVLVGHIVLIPAALMIGRVLWQPRINTAAKNEQCLCLA